MEDAFPFQLGDFLCSMLTSTLPKTNTSPLKMDGLKMIVSFWVSAYFKGRTVSFREGNDLPI